MTATTTPSQRSDRGMLGFLDDSPPYVRPILYAVGGLALLSIVRILAGAPDLTAGDTFIAAIGAMSPIVFAALGGLFAERVGVVNIGLEGMMIMGTWFAGWAGWQWGPWAAIVAGAVRRRAGRAAAGRLHGHLRRRPHRGRHRHQPAGPGRLPLPVQRGVRRQRGRHHHPVPHHVRVDPPLHVPVPGRGQPVRLEDARSVRLAGRQAVVLRVRPGRARTRLHHRAWPSPPSSPCRSCRSRPTCSGGRPSGCGSGRSARSRRRPTRSAWPSTGSSTSASPSPARWPAWAVPGWPSTSGPTTRTRWPAGGSRGWPPSSSATGGRPASAPAPDCSPSPSRSPSASAPPRYGPCSCWRRSPPSASRCLCSCGVADRRPWLR